MTGSLPKSVHCSVMTKSEFVRWVEDMRMMLLLHNIPNRTINVCVQRLNDDQRGMSRLEDHIPTIPCGATYGATICMADFHMQKTGLAVMFLIISQEQKVV